MRRRERRRARRRREEERAPRRTELMKTRVRVAQLSKEATQLSQVLAEYGSAVEEKSTVETLSWGWRRGLQDKGSLFTGLGLPSPGFGALRSFGLRPWLRKVRGEVEIQAI